MEKYSAESIKVLKGLEPVRMRPGMYIGSTGKRGLHHLVYEVVDNSVDEALAGYCDWIRVTLHEDGSVEVEDNGRGIPVDIHPEEGRSALEVVFTVLHAGGKFSKDSYKISGGLHGVGVSVVNALSEWLEVRVHRDGKIYRQRYERGKPVTPVEVIGETDKHGTIVRFKPDPLIFSETEFDPDILEHRLREIAFLVPGLKIEFEDRINGEKKTFKFDGGIVEYVKYLNRGKKALHDVIHIKRTEKVKTKNGEDEVIVEIAFQYTDSYSEDIVSFANTIKTVDGGTHVTAFKSTLTRLMNEYGKKHNFLKKDDSFQGEDVREGLTAVISVYVKNPEFEGQTKSKLGNEEVKEAVTKAMREELKKIFDANPELVKTILSKIMSTKQAREAAKRAREMVRRKNVLQNTTLPGKLADCSSTHREKTELFIVEGDSAGGSAKQARDREFQAVLPIRGKILNVEKSSLDRLLKNEQISDIIVAVGTGIGDDFDESKLRYGRIIIMTDADIDGAHIRTLLLTLFYRYMRPLIEQGRVYIALPPLYRIKAGREEFYVYSDQELAEYKEKLQGKRIEIQRYKGLGEMNPEQLWETTMNPETRKIIRVTIEDAEEADRLFEILMGNDPSSRREFIERHALKVKELDI
ncbi:DNA gyrase subunit B [Thermotoga maritima MSB8]|uniref:DNA gyrase subunit B n=2 Tax=Thermotoga maritima TaxID=2336 RepID=GYRB_THEMA|nr:DNA topoisomerase (ATP-hydrolyzing) subunit B [Thermotoga maritima]P77993.2 RecName: Full=DNA gyrase subunit B [Thermotoga maritima MSB8]AAD35915.1 DNA gyrase, subunit B [Thermotoga maritima MSB8]AGL49760.1 DNA gyrase subunit B [Thermotoga maritima MSB8]AHD17414.1 DNA gyrase subunit B [Thermotoga maritima MSB8]AKE26748.1 DNA gyrase subunit B [Thermotoga maritima]AKE28613.1 DNA gyrase subunit B [Thermotoga maritima MSB8]